MNYLNPMNRLTEDQKHAGTTRKYLSERLTELHEIRTEIYQNDKSTFSEGRFERDRELAEKCLGQIGVLRNHLDSIARDINSALEDNYNTHKAAVLWYVRQVHRGPTIAEVVDEFNSGHWSYYDIEEAGIKIAITDLLLENKIRLEEGFLRV